ncbi:hypothetical protein [uncultured Ligilactobacillus sp.]|uniref:hypothetical protein n=1 Tax=uncultured Ligilactobacillus sp. TaxID=2837633 RepID=UPI00272C3410|nr:hypothetical protein [uncultured Ligilactobacillus sp.]
MFITRLTKRDWYRIYKYLWQAQLLPQKIRICVKTVAILRILLAVWVLFPIVLRVLFLLLLRAPLTYYLSYYEIFLIITVSSLLIFYYPLLFWAESRRFSPKVFITLKQGTSLAKLKKIRKRYPTAYITPNQGMFEPPFNSKWIVINFEDCYLLVAKGKLPYDPKRHFISFGIIRYKDIKHTITFSKQLEPVCERIVNYSDVKLLHEE